jgi:hypothetical protein
VFESYVQSRLTVAENELDDDEEEIEGIDDVIMFSDQLLYVSTLARWDPASCINLISNLIGDRFAKLQELFAKARAGELHDDKDGWLL